jgi:hypothetical protein
MSIHLTAADLTRHGQSVSRTAPVPQPDSRTRDCRCYNLPGHCSCLHPPRSILWQESVLGLTVAYMAQCAHSTPCDRRFHTRLHGSRPGKELDESPSWHRSCNICFGHCAGYWRLVDPQKGEESEEASLSTQDNGE